MPATGLRDERLVGAFTAIVTPLSPDGASIDFTRLAEQISFQALGGVRGIVVCGTTGETPTLSDDERVELIRRAVDLAHAHGLVAIAGTGSNDTARAVRYQREAAEAGADATLCVCPYYNRPGQPGLFQHFRALAEAAPVGMILYNVPSRTGCSLAAETIERLADLPNVVGVKEASGSLELASEIAMRAPDLSLLSGDDALTLPMAAVGAVGVVSVVSNLLPRRVAAMCDEFLTGRFAAARAIHQDLLPLCRALFIESNPIPVKAAMALVGRDSGAVRLPLTRAQDATLDRLRAELQRLALLPADSTMATATSHA